MDEGAQQPAPPEAPLGLRGATTAVAADFARIWPMLASVRWSQAVLVVLAMLTFFTGLGMAGSGDFGVGPAFVPLLIVVGLWLLLRASRRGWAARRADELGPGEVRYELDEVGVRLLASRLISERPWSDFKAYRDHGELLELVPRRGPELLLPTRAFDADSLELLRQQLRRRLEDGGGASAVLRGALAGVALLVFLGVWHFFSVDAPPSRRERSAASAELPEDSTGGGPAVDTLK